jgi:tRNA(fMet)-specific endonuclease VapC
MRYPNEVVYPSMAILPYSIEAAEWHAAERARLTAIGKTPPFADGQIIAVAFANDLTLVTLNPSDYASFSGVKIENWNC